MATVTDSATGIKTTYYYDFTDRMMKYVESGNSYSHSVGYEYDTINNLTKLVETINGVKHTTSYTYDKDNRVTTVNADGKTVSYTYDSYGRVTQQVTKNGSTTVLTEYFTYRAPVTDPTATTGQIATYRTVSAGYDVTYTYTYDANGNIASVYDGTNTTQYHYDSANQLIREDNPYSGNTTVWVYDDAGNITSRAVHDYTRLRGIGEAQSEVDYSYNDSWGDLLNAYDGQAITYDTIGNPLTDGTWTYTWQHGRQLASMTDGTYTWYYTYNADGLRTSRNHGATSYDYIYNGDKLTQMDVADLLAGDGEGYYNMFFAYDTSGTPMTVTFKDTIYYYVTNIQGDVVGILDGSGNQVVGYTYDAWGNILETSGTMASTLGFYNPLRYRSYVYDQETKLYYLQSRYYNPETIRFLNADAISATGQELQGQNIFAYCGNNPICNVDDNGMSYRPVGAGIQLEMEVGNAVVGIEVIVFWDVEECVEGNPVIAVYVYGGIAINAEDAFLASILALVTDNASLLTGGTEQITIGLASLTALITCNFSISVSGLVVMGNEKFTSTDSYTGSFTSVGGGWGRLKGGIAYSDSCYAVSVGGSIVGNKVIPSWGVSKTYYHKLVELPIRTGNSLPVRKPTLALR